MSNPETHSAGTEGGALARLGIGARLKAAREARGMSRQDLAQRLRLDEHVIEALETDDLERLPAPTFVRGYMRNYARLVGLDESLVAEALPEADATPAAALKRRRGERGPLGGPVLGRWPGYLALLVILAGLVVLAYPAMQRLWDGWGEPVTTDAPGLRLPAAPEAAAPGVDGAALEPIWPLPEALEPTVPDEAPDEVPEPPPMVERSEVAAPAPAPEAVAPEGRLVLHFREESWVEIRDRQQRLLYGLMSPGRREVLSGTPPFQVVLGNAPGVELQYDGQPIDTAAHARGAVARLRLE